MPRKAKTEDTALNDYERRQIERIALWKASHPSPYAELFSKLARPITRLAERVIPDALAMGFIESVYQAAVKSATRTDIELQGGVRRFEDLRNQPLEVCDGLSRRVGTMAQSLATVEGALTGAGGVWTALLDVPLLFGVCLRTILKNGYCYGYALDRPTDKAWVLGALAVAISNTKEKRTRLMARLREIEDLLLEEVQEDIIFEETVSLLTQIEVFEDIPLFGAATGALLNLAVAHRADVTARHLFQERWLRDHGKVREIEPAEGFMRQPNGLGWSGALARAGYGGIYGVSFAAAVPMALAGKFFTPFGRAVNGRSMATA
jgi:hypothetical protein